MGKWDFFPASQILTFETGRSCKRQSLGNRMDDKESIRNQILAILQLLFVGWHDILVKEYVFEPQSQSFFLQIVFQTDQQCRLIG